MQSRFAALRFCLLPKVVHLWRTTSPDLPGLGETLEGFQTSVAKAILTNVLDLPEAVLEGHMRELPVLRLVAALPTRAGGLGLGGSTAHNVEAQYTKALGAVLEWLAKQFPDNPDTQTLRNWAARPMTAYNLKPGSANDNECKNETSGWPARHLPPQWAIEASVLCEWRMRMRMRMANRGQRMQSSNRRTFGFEIALGSKLLWFRNCARLVSKLVRV